MINELNESSKLTHNFESLTKKLITKETREWEPNLDTSLPIDGHELPNFKAWVNWNGFSLDRETGKGHSGYDFAAYLSTENIVVLGLPPETKIRAVADGRIAQVLDNPDAIGGGYGVMLTIEHGADSSGMFSQYVHVKPLIKEGVEARKGDIVAELYKDPGENEGRLVHLHFELISGWGTKGTSITGGGRYIRTEDPRILSNELCGYNANPQGSTQFKLLELPELTIKTVNFKKVKAN